MSDHEDLLQAMQEAVAARPEDPRLRRGMARVFMKREQWEQAIEHLQAAVAQGTADAGLYMDLAHCLNRTGRTSAALAVVESALAHGAVPADLHMLHARLLLRSGDFDGAVVAYRHAMAGNPALADADLAEILQVPSGLPPSLSAIPDPLRQRSVKPDPDHDADDVNVEDCAPESDGRPERIRVSREAEDGGPVGSLERPKVDFGDVGGMEQVKDEIRLKIIEPMKHPDLYEAYGKAAGGGILMYGPPGCGKTLLARATAGQVDAHFLAVGLHDVLDMYLGNSEQRLHAIFQQARSHTPCVLFFDEVDALAASRSDLRQSAGRQLINQFLSELDGMAGTNEGVLILAATNAPWHLDSAFRRPGRFDRILFVPPPDLPARVAALRVMLAGKPIDEVDLETLAKKTDGYSGADLKALVDIAVEAKLRKAMASGKRDAIMTRDLAKAAKQVKPSTRDWFASARNYALYANEAGFYDDVLAYLKLS